VGAELVHVKGRTDEQRDRQTWKASSRFLQFCECS